jgi:S-adenosylmethionine synthetase
MFGYATDETPECMPLSLLLAHRLAHQLGKLRKSGELAWLRPDCKSQVTVEYKLDQGATIPLRVHTIVISAQHAEEAGLLAMRNEILEYIIKVTENRYFICILSRLAFR